MRKNVGFEASFGLGLFYLCFLNILNRGMGRVEILWKIKTSKTMGLRSCFKLI